MAIPKKVINFLEKYNIKHDILEHKTVYTAFDVAQTMKEKISDIAKTLAIKVDKKYALIVIPANRKLDIEKLKKSLGVKKISIIKEINIEKIFKVKTGKLLPFGTFHRVPVYIDNILLKSKAIIISSGSHTESLKIKTQDLLIHGGETLKAISKVHKFKIVKKTQLKKKKAVLKKKKSKKISVKKSIKKNNFSKK